MYFGFAFSVEFCFSLLIMSLFRVSKWFIFEDHSWTFNNGNAHLVQYSWYFLHISYWRWIHLVLNITWCDPNSPPWTIIKTKPREYKIFGIVFCFHNYVYLGYLALLIYHYISTSILFAKNNCCMVCKFQCYVIKLVPVRFVAFSVG